MFKYLITALLITSSADAMSSKKADESITLEYISSKPSGRVKNFLIWQYLKQDISPALAKKAYEQVSGEPYQVYKEYLKKTDDEKIKKNIECQKQNLLEIEDYECFKLGFSTSKVFKLTTDERVQLLSKLKTKESKEIVSIIDEPYLQKNYEKYSADTILTFFNESQSFRRNYLNINLDKNFINKLSSSWRISQFVENIVNDDSLDKLQLSLLHLNGEKLNSQTNFLLALNQIRHNQEKEAIRYFRLSLEKAKNKMNRDKNYFWLYQITKDKRFLERLADSVDINIYSLYALDIINKQPKNYFTVLDTGFFNSSQKLTDPFVWNEILEKIKETPDEKLFDLADEYSQKNMMPVQNFILEKAYKYNVHGFIMPYDEYLQDISVDQKALIYAIMRQESNFVPSALSRSFALGLMQLMPFLVDALSKQFKEDIKYSDMFIPKNNIKYALKHLQWMEKSLYHPLFMAYAYNGGMGFLKRHLESTGRFGVGKYEPYMSMELMMNDESREYGKKVVANYVMYKEILGEKVSLISLLDTLTDPKKTDRFRVPN